MHNLVFLIVIIFSSYLILEKLNNNIKDELLLGNKNLYKLKDNKEILKSRKPLLWIYIPKEYNSRKWYDFQSRSSHEVNQSYLNYTFNSIHKCCGDYFEIIIIDEDSFKKLIPNWNIDMKMNPSKKLYTYLGILHLIYLYGGISVPVSFLCLHSLDNLWEKLNNSKISMIVGENVNKKSSNISHSFNKFSVDISFIGGKKDNCFLYKYINFVNDSIQENLFSNDLDFTKKLNNWLENKEEVYLINGKYLGTKTEDNEPILIDNLFSTENVNFSKSIYGIYIPMNDVLQRTKFSWYASLPDSDILNVNCILTHYIKSTV